MSFAPNRGAADRVVGDTEVSTAGGRKGNRGPFVAVLLRMTAVGSCRVVGDKEVTIRPVRNFRIAMTRASEPAIRLDEMKRVVIFGRAAAGKSSLARTLGEITGLPVIELDKIFWQSGLQALPPGEWASIQNRLIQNSCWIMDGDLGPYDVADCRIQAADTIIFLDFSLVTCAWRAIRRSRERADFWRWLVAYRRKYRPALTQTFASCASTATLYRLRNPRAVERFIEDLTRTAALRRE